MSAWKTNLLECHSVWIDTNAIEMWSSFIENKQPQEVEQIKFNNVIGYIDLQIFPDGEQIQHKQIMKRAFNDYNEHNRFRKRSKGIRTSKINNQPDMFDAFDRILDDSKIINEQQFIKKNSIEYFILENELSMIPVGTEVKYSKQDNFNVSLREPFQLYDHQKKMVKWLCKIEYDMIINPYYFKNQTGGVLAAEMGLGKTVTCAELIAHTIDDQREHKSCTLYICPKNLLGTAKHEFYKFLGKQLKIIILHRDYLGDKYENITSEDISKCDIIITNYSTIQSFGKKSKLIQSIKKQKQQRALLSGEYSILKKNNQLPTNDHYDSMDIDEHGMRIVMENRIKSEKDRHKWIDNKINEQKQQIIDENSCSVQFMNFNWFRIILDESHEIRNSKTIIFKSITYLTSPRRHCLSGTPIHNGVKDLVSQFQFGGFNPKHKLIKQQTRTRMNDTYLTNNDLYKMVRFVKLSDAKNINLPNKNVILKYFDLNPDERFLTDFYNNSNQQMMSMLQSNDNNESIQKKTVVMDAIQAMLKLMRLCSAPYLITPAAYQRAVTKNDNDDKSSVSVDDVYSFNSKLILPNEEGFEEWLLDKQGSSGIGSSKMLKFVEIIDNNDVGEKFVIFANYTTTINLAIEAIEKKSKYKGTYAFLHGGLNCKIRDKYLKSFQTDPNCNLLFITLKSGCVGLNLIEASSVIFLSPWYNPAFLSQGEGRVHRIGQTKEVNIYYLLARNSIESNMFKIAQTKKAMGDSIQHREKELFEQDECMLKGLTQDDLLNMFKF